MPVPEQEPAPAAGGPGRERPVAAVSGGSRGIGRAVAVRLAHDGFDLAFCFRDRSDAADEVAHDVTALGARVVAVKADVSDPEQARSFVTAAEAELGPLAAVVTCAGVTRDTPLVLMRDDQWRDVIETNLHGTYHICRSSIFSLMKRRTGKIVTMSSIAGIYGNATQANYSASKAGIIGFTLALAKECGKYGIRANAVAPGFIDTEMTGAVPDKIRQQILERIPLARFGTPDDVADVVSFLLSSRASYLTGQVIGVNGGLVI